MSATVNVEQNPIFALLMIVFFLITILIAIPIMPSVGYDISVDGTSIAESEVYASSTTAYDAFIGFSPLSNDRSGNKRVNISIINPESGEIIESKTHSFSDTFSKSKNVFGDIYLQKEGPFEIKIRYQEFSTERGWYDVDSTTKDLAYS